MATLEQIRGQLVEDLAMVDAPVVGVLPARFTPPIGVLVPGSPYVEAGDTFGAFAVRYNLVIIAGAGDSEQASTALDELIAASVLALAGSHNFFLDSIEQPALYKHGGVEYLACVVSVLTHQPLEG